MHYPQLWGLCKRLVLGKIGGHHGALLPPFAGPWTCPVAVTLSRVANVNVYTLTDVEALHLKSRRVWVGISDPTTPNRKLDDEATETLNIWLQLLVSTPFSLSMCPPDWIQVNATADAMASQSMAGLGVQPSFLMVPLLGSSFAFHCLKLNRYGPG